MMNYYFGTLDNLSLSSKKHNFMHHGSNMLFLPLFHYFEH